MSAVWLLALFLACPGFGQTKAQGAPRSWAPPTLTTRTPLTTRSQKLTAQSLRVQRIEIPPAPLGQRSAGIRQPAGTLINFLRRNPRNSLSRPEGAAAARQALGSASAQVLTQSILGRSARMLPSASPQSVELQGRLWDGGGLRISGPSTDDTGEPEFVAPAQAEPGPEALELRFSRDAKARLKRSETFATVRLLGGSGSKWHWGRFAGDVPLRVLVGGRTFFHTRVTEGASMAVEDLTKADLEGVVPERNLRSKNIRQLRRKVMDDLVRFSRFAKPGKPAVVTPKSMVRVVRFLPYREARHLDANRPEEAYEPRPRSAVEVPQALALLHVQPPKIVLLDLRRVEGPLGVEFTEDIGKLQKAGIYFVLLTDKPLAGPGSLEEQLTAGLTTRQREELVRYKLFAVTEGGNRLHEFRGAFPRNLRLDEFSREDLDLMEWAARVLGADPLYRPSLLEKGPTRFSLALPEGASPEKYAALLRERLWSLGMALERLAVQSGTLEGRPFVSVRPNTLPRAIPQVLAALQENHSVYVQPSDVLLLTEDESLEQALPGSASVHKHAPGAAGRDLVETGLAAMLGEYRENRPGDLAASASKITQFLQDPDQRPGSYYNIYMLMGHVIHAAFNWAVWSYRGTGAMPALEEVIARAVGLLHHEDTERARSLLDRPGESMAGYQEALEARLRNMYQIVADVLRRYPIAVGTELPNFHVFNRFKNGEFQHRDILRFIFDFVAARETKDGIELLVVDFKTGQTYTLQGMEKDTQVQLYDLIVQKKWRQLALPYGLTGTASKAALAGVRFIFPNEGYQPAINEWGRVKFEKWLAQVMNRMRRHKAREG